MMALPMEIERHRFNAEEYHRMLEVGVLSEDDRVELIGGELVDMTPIGGAHLTCVVNLTHSLVGGSDGRYFVSVQNPVRLGLQDEPEPDRALLREPPRGRMPVPEDVLLLIEVSDTPLTYDKDVKLPLYARANRTGLGMSVSDGLDDIREAYEHDLFERYAPDGGHVG